MKPANMDPKHPRERKRKRGMQAEEFSSDEAEVSHGREAKEPYGNEANTSKRKKRSQAKESSGNPSKESYSRQTKKYSSSQAKKSPSCQTKGYSSSLVKESSSSRAKFSSRQGMGPSGSQAKKSSSSRAKQSSGNKESYCMARPLMDSQYRELLNPVRDPEQSFQINISSLLTKFVEDIIREGKTNFNSAALVIQGSASIYGKKVEYLHNLATRLFSNVIAQKKDDQPQAKEKETKEKQKKEEKFNDPYQSTDIRVNRSLTGLKRRNAGKSSAKKSVKKNKGFCIPVVLLTIDNEDKGEVFNDTRGEPIGNIGDYASNSCRMIKSGFLLLPTFDPTLVPALNSVPEYYNDFEISDQIAIRDACQTPGMTDDIMDTPTDDIQASPDEGFGGSYPESNSVPGSTQGSEMNSQETNTPTLGSTAPPSTDEGIGSTPTDDLGSCHSGDGIENVPTNNGDELMNEASVPVRHSTREALMSCQLAQDDDPLCGPGVNKNLIVKRKIQKKNCRTLPLRLTNPGAVEEIGISEYCARTFFFMDDRSLKNSLLAFDCTSFERNNKLTRRIKERIDALKSTNRKNMRIDPIEDEREIDVDGIENLNDADADDTLIVPFDDRDVVVNHDPAIRPSEAPPPVEDPELPLDAAALPSMPSPDISQIAIEAKEIHNKELQLFMQHSDITERVHAWEKSVKPFLEEVDKRESFDIHLYGSRILNSFEDTNRKQTKTFKHICRNKQKWEIHRYFMALLPLANIGNVSLESERKEDGSDDIFVTLLSRKMHHKELEEFGHNDGSHS